MMDKEQYEAIKSFAHDLTEKRLQMPDGQLLDQCQAHLDALLAHVELDFEEHPVDLGHEPRGEVELEHIEEEDRRSGFEPPIPPQLHRMPGPPPEPVHIDDDPDADVTPLPTHSKKAPHKRPTPRKTHR